MTNQAIWDDIRVFLAVSRAGSLSGAAEQLGLGVATVSRRIARLESALALPLFSHHQQGYQLTADGSELIARAEAAESAITGLLAASSAAAEQLAGRVRVATAEYLAADILLPALPAFLEKYPGLSIDIATDVNAVNLHRRDADLAIRMVRPEHGNLRVRRIATLSYGLYGSASYLQRSAIQQKLDNQEGLAGLRNGDFVAWPSHYDHLPPARWLRSLLRGREPKLTVTSLTSKIAALKAGLGLGILPHLVAIPAGLVAIASPQLNVSLAESVDQDIWLAIHNDLAKSPRVRATADFLVQVINDKATLLQGGQQP